MNHHFKNLQKFINTVGIMFHTLITVWKYDREKCEMRIHAKSEGFSEDENEEMKTIDLLLMDNKYR